MDKDLNYYNWNITKTFNANEVQHIDLPSNILQKYRYININNPSFYDLHLFISDPDTNAFIQPFEIIPQNSLLSFEIPTEISYNGIFILPIYNPLNSVKYEKRAFIQFSQNNNGWDEKGKENNNMNVIKYSTPQFKHINEANFEVTENNMISFIDIYRDAGENIPVLISFFVKNLNENGSYVLYDTNSTNVLNIHNGYNYTLFNIDQTNNDIAIVENNGDPFNMLLENFKILVL